MLRNTLPRSEDDVEAIIVEDSAEIEPAPSEDLDIGEISVPELIDRCVLPLNSLAALMTMKAGLVIRSCALSIRYVEASDTE